MFAKMWKPRDSIDDRTAPRISQSGSQKEQVRMSFARSDSESDLLESGQIKAVR